MHNSHMVGALLFIMFLTNGTADAQDFRPEKSSVSSYKAINFSMPLYTMTRERVARLEFNLSGQGSLALEGSLKNRREEISEKNQLETGESLIAEGYGVSLLISRYSSGANMSGFFWTLGGGVRQEQFDWHVAAEKNDPQADFSLVNDKNQFEHEATAKGGTGHLRIGYRYVGTSLPIAAGFYIGARHFQADIQDAEIKDKQKSNENENNTMTELEKERLKRRIATAPDIGIEFGFSF